MKDMLNVDWVEVPGGVLIRGTTRQTRPTMLSVVTPTKASPVPTLPRSCYWAER